ncbi:MAG: YHYH protein [Candidatus Marinimicrobia bacterium]|nr:YHYH protein [Candidatus Neomarinimicrobiota bacterium]
MKLARSILFISTFIIFGCDEVKKNTDDDIDDMNAVNFDLTKVFKHFDSSVSVYTEGDYIVIKADGVPGHRSPYFPKKENLTQNGYYYWVDSDNNGVNDMWSDGQSGFRQNPNYIAEKNYTFRVQLKPEVSNNTTDTFLGPIGVSINGAPLFNQYEGGNTVIMPGQGVARSLDGSSGHPAPRGDYHYHMIPDSILSPAEDNFLGFAADGFPVYGPKNDDGKNVSGLDDSHGEFGPTPDFPNGIYHYHTTSTAPYIVGSFRGTVGSGWGGPGGPGN